MAYFDHVRCPIRMHYDRSALLFLSKLGKWLDQFAVIYHNQAHIIS